MANGVRPSSGNSRGNRGATRLVFGPWALVVLVLGILMWSALPAAAQTQAPGTGLGAPPGAQPPGVGQPTPPALPGLPPPPPGERGPRETPQVSPGFPPGGFQSEPMLQPPGGGRRFDFKINPLTPLKDLLPTPPKVKKITGPFLSEDLTRVPEVQFQAPPAKNIPNHEATRQTAHLIARINHLNDNKADGFLEALTGERADLAGLPFAMGDACRTKGERSRQFARAVNSVRRAMQSQQGAAMSGPGGPVAMTERRGKAGESFWDQFQAICIHEDKLSERADPEQCEHIAPARIAALMQVLMPESSSLRLGLVKYLSTVPHIDATKALARLAIFSAEDEVRKAAVDALKLRRERDYTDILMQGLRYPLPAVAKRAGEAVVKLERNDLLPKLVDLLEEPDPRAPTTQEVNDKRVPVVRELVRINHHQSCLLCHSPANTGKVAPETLTAAVPNPTEPLTPPSQGYRQSASTTDTSVRIDVTYLRQDFSLMQPVADANPWPEMQRFDFFVRTRTLTEEAATAYREKLDKREPGRPSPYQRVVLAALRDLTGRDAEPTPEAWRRLLKLPAEQR